ncbi:MAG: 2OG-Fe(II) oxygenase [Ferruginibacter sp.]
MEKTFNTLIDSFIANKIGIADSFVSNALSKNLKANLIALYAAQQLKSAGTGNIEKVTHDQLFRGDKIYWLDRKHNDEHENAFFDLIDAFIVYLNETCYTGITGYEFHYTLYEKGTFYKKHIDQFRNNDSRKYSMITYLNSQWQKEDGGELCIYQNGNSQNIEPNSGKTVFFQSNALQHEVRITHQQRMSITGWLKC